MLNKPVLITGCARSGTSMTAGVINLCGAWCGRTSGATPYNKKGMFEIGEIRDILVKPLLRDLGYDPMGQKPLPATKDFHIINHNKWRDEVLKIIVRQGYTEDKGRWMYKGAKMCLMWPLWHKAFPEAQWIIVRRRSEDIITSCLKTGFMKAYRDRAGWKGWIIEHVNKFKEMYENGLEIREIFPQEMVDGQYADIASIISWLGLDFKEKEIKEFISPELWTAKKEVKSSGITSD